MIFTWHKSHLGKHGVLWTLKLEDKEVARCFYLPGSRVFQCNSSVPVPAQGGNILLTHQGKTARSARKALEQELDRRSIGLWNVDDITFTTA